MFYFACRTRISVLPGVGRNSTSVSQSRKLFHNFPKHPSILAVPKSNTRGLKWMTTGSDPESLTASYLINKLGFSTQSAFKASKRFHLKSLNNADIVISFFEKYGFSQSQIKTMVRKDPRILASNVEKTFLPKLEYLLSKGFSRPDLAKLISCVPSTLYRSLERHIIPFFNAYSHLVRSNKNTVKAINHYQFLILCDIDIINGNLLSNINFLRGYGVPESNIIKLLHQYPRSLLINPGSFKEIVEEVKEIGLDPRTLKFVYAVNVLNSIKKSTLPKKVDAFKKWGWSDEDIWECFRKYPFCFAVSEDMIMTKMDFLVNKMGIDASHVANQPSVLTRSFEKRIVPRGLIAQHLVSKGLIKKDFSLYSLFDSAEKIFLKMFVTRYVAEAPELMKLYKANLKI